MSDITFRPGAPPDSATPMDRGVSRYRRWARWYEHVRCPGLVLAVVVACLYGPFLGCDFTLDDYRMMRLLREYDAGRRETLDLYRFLSGGVDNQAKRAAGWYPWWLGDDVRYRHLRPLGEAAIRAEYWLFGETPFFYRVVTVAVYALGVRLVLAFYRSLGGKERRARWGALAFAVAASHTIPVLFLSAQGDVVSLALTAGAMLGAARFIRDRTTWGLILAVVCYSLGLGVKEAVLPVAVLPLALAWVFRGRTRVWRRAVGVTALLVGIGLGWLAVYARGGYGADTFLMLDPVHAPWGYLAALPGRALVLLSTWPIPVNPFIFYFCPGWHRGLYIFGALGALVLCLLVRSYYRNHRGEGDTAAMAFWALPFLPLLVCTVPDDRVMMLPGIGLAYLAAVWITRPGIDGSVCVRKLPVVLFVALQISTGIGVSGIMRFIEHGATRMVTAAVDGFGRALQPGDHVFFLNSPENLHALFTQDRCRCVTGSNDVHAGFLSDVASPRIEVVDDHTLRIEAKDEPLMTTFVGLMGRTRERPKRVGDVLEAGVFRGRIVEMDGEGVTAVELRFDQPLDSDSYRFYWCSRWSPPELRSFSGWASGDRGGA
ncbi:MAG: ArnT family glycosyltransferase [Phycisphaerae bacterium]